MPDTHVQPVRTDSACATAGGIPVAIVHKDVRKLGLDEETASQLMSRVFEAALQARPGNLKGGIEYLLRQTGAPMPPEWPSGRWPESADLREIRRGDRVAALLEGTDRQVYILEVVETTSRTIIAEIADGAGIQGICVFDRATGMPWHRDASAHRMRIICAGAPSYLKGHLLADWALERLSRPL